MTKKTISYLLKTVVIFLLAAFLFAGFFLIPAALRLLQRYEPTLASIATGVAVYINLAFVPVYVCLLLAWKVFSTIGKDDAFCTQNARRLQAASWLAIADTVMLIAFNGYLHATHPQLMGPFFLFLSLCLMLLGMAAAVVCFALSKLVLQAAELKQEVDLTV